MLHAGAWPNGKAPLFGSGIRRFDPCRPSHFLFENNNAEGLENIIYEELISNNVIDENGIFKVKQNEEGLDTEDRIVKLVECINSIIESV